MSHYCEMWSNASRTYGSAIGYCEEDDGYLWVSNDEYTSVVDYCPVCGCKAQHPAASYVEPSEPYRELQPGLCCADPISVVEIKVDISQQNKPPTYDEVKSATNPKTLSCIECGANEMSIELFINRGWRAFKDHDVYCTIGHVLEWCERQPIARAPIAQIKDDIWYYSEDGIAANMEPLDFSACICQGCEICQPDQYAVIDDDGDIDL